LKIAREFSESECLRLIKEDDSQAFDALFWQYSSLVYRFAYGYLKSQSEAEDIVQQCFLKMWEKRHQLREDVPLKSYLFTTAHHAILNQLRHSQYQRIYQEYLLRAGTKVTGNEVEFSELETLYLAALDQLPPKRRQIFELSRQQGLSYPEIAQELNISVKTVEAQMTQALKFLREYFQQNGTTLVVVPLLFFLRK